MNDTLRLIQEINTLTRGAHALSGEHLKNTVEVVYNLTESYLKQQQTLQQESAVHHPSHYRPNTYEAIKVIQAWELNFALGNVVKYVCRAGLKDKAKTIEDLQKAEFYLKAEIQEKLTN